jgi:diguanylate cyclase (GGDEF)-like protein/PAS domain S-box-containing protein
MTSNQPLKREPAPLYRRGRSDAASGSQNDTSAVFAEHLTEAAFDSLRTTDEAADLRLQRLKWCFGPAIGVSADITERKHAQEALRRLSAIIDSSGDAIVGKTIDGTIISWNRGAENLYGYSADEVIGHDAGMLAPDAFKDELADVLRRVALGETVERLETTRRHKEGALIDISFAVSPVYDQAGAVVGCLAITRDITARAEAQRALQHQAVHDALTGLPNRVLLADRLTQALSRARRQHQRVAVLFLDLDGFKHVNDGLGHLAGDELLVEVARRLAGCVRSDDTLARFGGDEFAIVCEVASTEVATRFGNRLLKALQPPFPLRGMDMFVSASIGLVVADPDAEPDELLQDADVAMYRAKERGRSRMELFDDELRDRASLTLQSSTALRGALERGELRVFYQPILNLDDNRPLAVEALLRWQHPERGLVSPDEFIPLAEDTGMIVPIGRWVLQQALRDRAGWEAELPEQAPIRLAVNLSARQLSEPALVDDITATLRDHGTDPSSLILEVTESVLMQDPGSLLTLNTIHDLGIALHVDDFGTGYSSLAYLKTLPVDALKIDRAFVDGIATNADDRAIVTAVLALARALTLEVVAEGVETPKQLSILRELGCDFAQGFLFARPLPYDEFLTWLRTRKRRAPRVGLPHRVAIPTVPKTSPPKSLDTIRALCHDLRQPLAVILLLARAEGGPTRRRMDGILEQAKWLSDMVENVIGGAAHDRAASVDVVDLVARCTLRARPAARCGIDCIGVGRAVAVVAPVALSRAVSCVLDNAVRAAGPGGHVTVEVNGTDSEVTIQVIDDGPGLGKVPTNNSLGLTITRALVCACGGAFELRPGPARGVIARIVLPAMPWASAS